MTEIMDEPLAPEAGALETIKDLIVRQRDTIRNLREDKAALDELSVYMAECLLSVREAIVNENYRGAIELIDNEIST
ncbi:hypothetical protein [Phyllobacterium pellucidum]|uniref:hypothetical protein n=1 Tax=Phyllobacterium pellucidum TaxID=2740464 RepID=UPI001D13573A|nr:hypothetical protein [Phyllobacterium sp. T1018]UGY08651.1 hypothetical protein LLE51_011440 [Phyllobacterium sp. T1018]